MPADEADLYTLADSAQECLEDLRKRGVSNSIFTKMVEKAFEKEDLAALMRVVASMRNKIQTHDACAGGQAAAVSGPLVPAPAPSASPASRPASPLALRLPFAPEPRLEPREANAAWGVNAVKRRRKPAFSSGADAPDKADFFHRFRTFAFEFGREKLKKRECLHRVTNHSVFEAFKTSAAAAQGDPEGQCFVCASGSLLFNEWLIMALAADHH